MHCSFNILLRTQFHIYQRVLTYCFNACIVRSRSAVAGSYQCMVDDPTRYRQRLPSAELPNIRPRYVGGFPGLIAVVFFRVIVYSAVQGRRAVE